MMDEGNIQSAGEVMGDWLGAAALARVFGCTKRTVLNWMEHVPTREVRGVGGVQRQARAGQVRAYLERNGLDSSTRRGYGRKEDAGVRECGRAEKESAGTADRPKRKRGRPRKADVLARGRFEREASGSGLLGTSIGGEPLSGPSLFDARRGPAGDLSAELERLRRVVHGWLDRLEGTPADALLGTEAKKPDDLTTAQQQQIASSLRSLMGEIRQLERQRAEIHERRAEVMPVAEAAGVLEYFGSYIATEMTGLAAGVTGVLSAKLGEVKGLGPEAVDGIGRVVAVAVREAVDAARARWAAEIESKARSMDGANTLEVAA